MPKKDSKKSTPAKDDSTPAVNRKLAKRLREEKGRQKRMDKMKAKRARQDERERVRETMGNDAPPKEKPKTIEICANTT
jgi:hypothetical protein